MMTTQRSKEGPMEFEWTNRPSTNIPPVWRESSIEEPPRKRRRISSTSSSRGSQHLLTSSPGPHDVLNAPSPAFPEPSHTPIFGTNQNVPFLFHNPPPHTPETSHWTPPPGFSPSKAFPQPSFHEVKDVDMAEASPPKREDRGSEENGRVMALGGMKRIFKLRHKSRERSRPIATKAKDGSREDSDDDSEGESPRRLTPMTQNTSNHYTLNLPAAPIPQSDLPNILLGYLQFFWNLSLILLFLYLVLQFVLTVQRDVEMRISEYSMDIVQDIAMCASQYKNNLCDSPTPALVHQCAKWEICMNRDPTIVGRAKVGAEMIAEVVNGFVEPISWKTLGFTLTSLSFLTLFINALLSLYRSHHITTAPVHHQPSFPLPPPDRWSTPSGGSGTRPGRARPVRGAIIGDQIQKRRQANIRSKVL